MQPVHMGVYCACSSTGGGVFVQYVPILQVVFCGCTRVAHEILGDGQQGLSNRLFGISLRALPNFCKGKSAKCRSSTIFRQQFALGQSGSLHHLIVNQQPAMNA